MSEEENVVAEEVVEEVVAEEETEA